MLIALTIITLAMPPQRRTQQTRINPTGTHLLHLGRETIVGKMPCLRAYALGGLEPLTL